MEEKQHIDLVVDSESQEGLRLDRFLAEKLPDFSRSALQKAIRDGLVSVNDKKGKSSYRVMMKDRISVEIEPVKEPDILPENIPLDILYEDEDIIVVNKPKQMVVHPAPGHYSGTLVNALMYHCKDSLSGINGVLRPGIVHRIDKDTTGALVACKNDKAHRAIAEQLAVHSITRTYHAIAYNNFTEPEGTVSASLARHPVDRKRMAIDEKNGKEAVTHYKVLDSLNKKYNYIACNLETGRTHQIRVHMASIGHPILGDTVYGPAKSPFSLVGQTLHAKTIGFVHPNSGEYMEFDAPLPEYFEKLLQILQN
ncbi:MAG: RluA family pseudouridine synthase [Lachnospiraceae bacterium]|nr:RluA family pseudouridine synthase [Lachnospiraceae bacterium]